MDGKRGVPALRVGDSRSVPAEGLTAMRWSCCGAAKSWCRLGVGRRDLLPIGAVAWSSEIRLGSAAGLKDWSRSDRGVLVLFNVYV